MKLTIISTGDRGAALGALQAASELRLSVAGWYAKGSHGGPPSDATIAWAKETLSPRMAARLNVQDSDGTLIVSFTTSLPAGSPAAYADRTVENTRKASLHIVLPDRGRTTIPDDVRKAVLAWISEARIATLHVTGPREAEEPGIQQAVHDALVWILEDEVRPSPRVQAFAESVIGPMVEATFAGVDRSAAPESLSGAVLATDRCKCGRPRWEHDMWGNGPCAESGCEAFTVPPVPCPTCNERMALHAGTPIRPVIHGGLMHVALLDDASETALCAPTATRDG